MKKTNAYSILAKPFIGVFIVIFLAAFSGEQRQILPTNLTITVLDDLGNTVEGAKVNIYASEEDYQAEKNKVRDEQKTDRKGRVRFSKLDPKVYWLLIEKDELSNIGGGERTDTLIEGRNNRVNVIIQ